MPGNVIPVVKSTSHEVMYGGAAGASKREPITIDSDEDEDLQPDKKRKVLIDTFATGPEKGSRLANTSAGLGAAHSSKQVREKSTTSPDINAELRAAHFARQARGAVSVDVYSDEALARRLQEEEDAELSQKARDKTGQGDKRGVHRSFRADGLGFWLLHTEGIEEEANSREHCVRLREVVVGDIQWALISNYLYDMDWLREEIPKLDEIPCVAVLFHRPDGHGGSISQFSGLPSNYRTYGPPLPERYGTHHSKFMLLGYTTGIRVIVLTCNHIQQDHYHMSDALWAQDFPKKSATDLSSPFEDTLTRYLEMAKWRGAEAGGKKIDVDLLRTFDFSAARAVLIVSAPGRHKDVDNWGHMAIRTALSKEEFEERFYDASLIAQFTSIGGFKGLAGKKLLKQLDDSLSAGRGLNKPPPDGISFIWPTRDEVRTSTKGYVLGGSIPGRQEQVMGPDAKTLFGARYCRFSSPASDLRPSLVKDPWGRGRAMPHIKTYLRHVGNNIAWLFLSSFNLSGAAWGRLEKDGTQIYILSYEMGVLLLPSKLPGAAEASRLFSCTEPHGQGVVACAAASKDEAAESCAGDRLRMIAGNYQGKRLEELHQGILALPVPFCLPPCRFATLLGPTAPCWRSCFVLAETLPAFTSNICLTAMIVVAWQVQRKRPAVGL